jgi:hypothetical protein
LNPEWWGSPLFQEEKYQEKPVKREYEIIIIISPIFNDTCGIVRSAISFGQ